MMQTLTASARSATPSVVRGHWARWWALALVWWTLDSVATATTYRGMTGVSGPQITRLMVANVVQWVPLTMLALWMSERVPIDRRHWRWSLPVTLAVAAAVVLVKAVIVFHANAWMGWYATRPPFGDIVLASVANNLFLFGLVIGVGHAIVNARRVQERDEQLTQAELLHLKAQLHPHFLFNALNTVSALVRTQPETATQMLAQLSTLLRHALQRERAQEVSLREELSILAAYVDIEQLRFEDRLRVVWRIAPDVMAAQVPHLLLQPLVENAIRHGIAPRSDPGCVEIAACLRDGALHLSVADDGVGRGVADATRAASGIGVGLSNTRDRLRQLYGTAHSLTVRTVVPHGLRVDIVLPFREAALA
jgi:two-component system, LytTR family, sensor kinase